MNARGILRRAPGPAIATDESGHVVAWNRAAGQLFAFESKAGTRGRYIHELLRTRDVFGNRLPETNAPFLDMVKRGEPIRAFEVNARKVSGERVQLSISIVVVLGSDSGRQDEIVYLLTPLLRRRRADDLLERVLTDLADGREVLKRAASGRGGKGRAAKGARLTRRQAQVLKLLAAGHDNRQIAKVLGVSVNTVRSHSQALLKNLGVRTRLEAVAVAFRDQLV